MIYTKNDDKKIIKNIVCAKDNTKVQEYIKNISKNESLINTNIVLSQALVAPRLQTEQVYFNFEDLKIELLEKIINSNLSFDTIKAILSDMNSLKDYYYLSEILDFVYLEPVTEYEIENIIYIDTLCKTNGVISEAKDILNSINKAENNTKVLELVRKI